MGKVRGCSVSGICAYGFIQNLSFLFLIQFNVPFIIISLIETSQLVGGAKREYPRKTT